MIRKQLNEDELFLMEMLHSPKATLEVLYPRGAFQGWIEGESCITVRTFQIPMLAYDCVLEDDDNLSEQENFEIRVKVGTIYIILGRRLGKTYVSLIGNILLKFLCYSNKEMTFSSYDEKHVGKVLDKVRNFFFGHPFFKQYKKSIRGNPEYTIEAHNGIFLYGINETARGKDPGCNWLGHHSDINFSDETQMSTEVSNSKKVDAIGESGCIEILAGVPLVTKVSPLGRILKDRDKQKNILRFPQYISNIWTDKVAKDREKEYGGKNTLNFKVNVEAELVEGASGAFDLERVRRNYNTEKIIKSFEITKENFSEYKHILILDKYKNSDRTFVFADIGDTAATEIGIIFRINKKYHLVYNITSYRLADNELSEMLAWIFKKVEGNFIGVDATGAGKPIYRQLCDLLETKKDKKVICDKCNKEYLKINLKEDKCPVCGSNVRDLGKKVIWIAFNENIVADFEKDDEGKAVLDDKGKPIFIEENTLIFAVQRLRILFYSELFVIPDNFIKFDEQFSAYFQVSNNNRLSFGSSADDHMVQSMQVFSIMEWQTENLPNINPKREIKKSGLGSFNF
ncbi:MAG: hypothetical protein V1901_03720 [Patescibacteria group bacterium]